MVIKQECGESQIVQIESHPLKVTGVFYCPCRVIIMNMIMAILPWPSKYIHTLLWIMVIFLDEQREKAT